MDLRPSTVGYCKSFQYKQQFQNKALWKIINFFIQLLLAQELLYKNYN